MRVSNATTAGSEARRRARLRWRSLTAATSAVLLVLGLTVALPVAVATPAAAATCTSNEIVCENQLPGTDPAIWDAVDGSGDDSIQGFATQISVNRGQNIDFKIKTDAAAYTIQIFRLGYYQGKGARKITDLPPSAPLPQIQPACATDPATEIYDCGTWGVSATWTVPSTAVSGVYIALLTRTDKNDTSQIPFIVRNDASHSDLVFQTSDPTWQAYNTYGQSDFYQGLANGRAYKVSYNRPFSTRGLVEGRDYLFSNEFPMIRFLERNGYDLSYISGLDTDIRGNLLTNHKAFLSVGHDEYWSQGQRDNVEAARDAGVNLAFFSGNEVYWKTRWEPSEDGTNTPNRTLVCYKDTWADQQLDPVTSTSTWRDPRFGVGEPENALTGTAYMSNNTDLAITVSAEEGKTRLWRNSGLQNLAAGSTATLAPHTVGYESDEDLDNGFRPAGLVRLSTTTGTTPQYLTDFGSTVAPGTTTHHLTLYKAASGALVFGAGTIQWAWGLDENHDGTQSPPDTRMQQATVNLLADMGAAATTLTSPGVNPATKSTDTAAPTAVITSPAAGSVAQGETVTVTGSATDTGGGVVAGVEVSLDGGASWHPATGKASFTYTGVVTGSGTSVIRARATDDSGNIQASPATVGGTIACPCSIFGSTQPKLADAGDGSAVTLGVKFSSSQNGFITGIRFYKAAANTGTHTGTLYKADGTVLSTVTFSGETASGWQTATFPAAVPVTAGQTYIAAYRAPNGHYSADTQYFAYRGSTGGPLTALGGYTNPNGVYDTGSAMPSSSYRQSNYYVDVVYSATDPTPLTVVATSPTNGATSVALNAGITATFSRDAEPESIAMTVAGPQNQAVPGTVSYDGPSRVATFTPSNSLDNGTTYSVSVTAAASGVGSMSAPATWSFTTALPDGQTGVCPCTLFNDSDTPAVSPSTDPNGVELGVAFSSDTGGQITGVRFYKDASNAGPHSVSLWSATGDLLATAAVSQESVSGWQLASFAAPVTVAAGTTYIASYRAPSGRYSYTAGGLAAAIDRPPLHTPAGAGRYTYGSTAPLNTSSANYFVDPVFTVDSSAAPTVVGITPSDQSTSQPIGSAIGVSFSAPVQPGSAQISLTDPTGGQVAGTLSNQTFGSTAGFTPGQPLAPGTTYTVTVSGAKNLGGTPMAAWTSTFTTSGASACPCSVLPSDATPAVSDSGDGAAVSLGLRFTAETDGYIAGLRFYRDAANTGVHTGTLYAADRSVLGTLTFPDAAAGWQTGTFAHAIPITAGTTYVASTFMPNGRYSYTSHFFDSPYVNSPLTGLLGTYAYGGDTFPGSSYNNGNYYVDVSFATSNPATAPAAPTGITATAGNNSATVTWTAPDDGGGQITRYTVTPNDGAADVPPTVVSGSPAGTSAVVGGLTNGTAYTFTVTATNAAGPGPASTPSGPVTPGPTAPAAPTAVGAVAGDGNAAVSWTAPATDGGAPITGYTVTPYIGTTAQATTTANGTSVVVTGLTNGTAYTFTVAATNSIGTGAASGPSPQVIPSGSRTCPCSLFAASTTPAVSDSGEGSAVSLGLRFTSSSNGYILGLRFYRDAANVGPHTGTLYSLDGTVLGSLTFPDGNPGWQSGTFADPIPVTAGTTYVASTYMPNGHYSYTTNFFGSPMVNSPLTGLMGTYAYGENAFPTSSYNNGNYFVDVSFATEPLQVPGAPSGVVATAGDGSASVSWTAPGDGGSAITGYTVTPYQGTTAQTALAVAVTGAPPATSVTVPGLTNGTAYTFQVTATNAVGVGAAGASAEVTTATVPGTPTGVVATAGDGSASVSWTAPGDGGSAITAYTVTPFIGGTAQTPVTVTGAPPATTTTVTGLTNGTAYTFTVAAANGAGQGAASTASAAVTPAAVPDPPTAVTAVAGSTQATVSWTAPASDGGSAITGYTVTPYAGTTAGTPATVSGTGTSTTVTGLTNGTAYTFVVAATNAVGTGAASAASAAVTPVTPTVPGAPTNVTGTPGNTQVVLTWTAPADGGAQITRYTVTPYIGTTAQTTRVAQVNGTPPATTATVTGLTNGTAYTFRVTATNSVGTSATYGVSGLITPATTPGAPTIGTTTAGDASATVRWTAPTSTGGSPITGYVVTPYIGTTAQTPVSVAGTATSTVVSGLTNGTAYTFRVAAVNVMGTGAQSAASAATTPFGVPGAPTGAAAVPGNQSLYLTWSAPASNGGSAITGYTVTRFANGVSQGTTSAGTNTNLTVNSLTNGTTYTFTVTATNARGTGPASTASAGVVPLALFVQGVSNRASGTTSVTATPTSNLTAGNRLIVMVGVEGTATTTAQSVTDAAGNTYTKVTSFRASDNTEMSIWTAPITAGGGTRPVVTARSSASATVAISVTEYAGLSTAAGAGAVDVFKTASGSAFSSGTAQSGATTGTTGVGEVAIGLYLDGGPSRSVSTPSGYTSRISVANNGTMEYAVADQTVWPTGSTPNAAFGISSFLQTMPWLAATVVFKRK